MRRLGLSAAECVIDVPAVGTAEFDVPAPVQLVRLRSATCAGTGADRRKLGCAIRDISVDGETLALSDHRLRLGFHAVEGKADQSWRWTNGDGLLVLGAGTSPRRLRFTVVALASACAA